MEWTKYTCERFKVDHLLIEAKASGMSAAQELQNSGEPDPQTIAAKVEESVDTADRALTDMYRVMQFQRLQCRPASVRFFYPWPH